MTGARTRLEKELYQLEVHYWDTQKAHDIKAHAKCVHKKFVGYYPPGRTSTRDELLAISPATDPPRATTAG